MWIFLLIVSAGLAICWLAGTGIASIEGLLYRKLCPPIAARSPESKPSAADEAAVLEREREDDLADAGDLPSPDHPLSHEDDALQAEEIERMTREIEEQSLADQYALEAYNAWREADPEGT